MMKNSRFQQDYSCLVLIVFVAVYVIVFSTPRLEGDTLALIQSIPNLLGCLHHGIQSTCSGVVYFPLSQFIPSTILVALGFSEEITGRMLVSLNLISFVASILLFYTAGKRWSEKPAGAILAAVLLSGYGLYYSSSSFNEATAFFLITLFVFACLSQWHWAIIFIINLSAGITKDIAPPFLFAMGIIALVGNWERTSTRERVKVTFVLLMGLIASMAMNGAFNWFRYASLQNTALLAKRYMVPNVTIWEDYFSALLISPNGGLLWAWLSWALLSAYLVFHAAKNFRLRRWRSSGRDTLTAMGFLILLLILHAGLAKWWSPFGWIAWGPRLTLPYLGGLLLLLCWPYRHILKDLSRYLLLNHRRAIVVGCVFGLFALPHILALIAPNAVLGAQFAPSSLTPALGLSPELLNPHGEGDVLDRSWTFFYLAFREGAWIKTSIFLKELHLLRNPAVLLQALLFYLMFPVLFVFSTKNMDKEYLPDKRWMTIYKRKILLPGSIVLVIGAFGFFALLHTRSRVDVQLIGFSPSSRDLPS